MASGGSARRAYLFMIGPAVHRFRIDSESVHEISDLGREDATVRVGYCMIDFESGGKAGGALRSARGQTE